MSILWFSKFELFFGCVLFSVDCGSNSDSGPNSPPSGVHGPLPNGNCTSFKEVSRDGNSQFVRKVYSSPHVELVVYPCSGVCLLSCPASTIFKAKFHVETHG